MSANTVVIEGAFTIENVSNILEQMRSMLSRSEGEKAIPVDLNGVTEFDGAALQLLMMFSKAAEKAGSLVELVGVPEVMKTVLTDFGVNMKSPGEVGI